ncbi:MAG: AAA family ATPase, partial [Rhodospirillales bacterium]|nr:AAA family ATPase [Rhodospirillales bacterium]
LAKYLGKDRPGSGRALVASSLFDAESLNTLYTMCRESGERGLMLQLLALDNIHAAPAARQIPKIDMLINGLIAYLKRDAIDGWLYRRSQDGVLLPWLVTEMRYAVPTEGKPYVIVSLLANTMQAAGNENRQDARLRYSGMTQAIVFDANDILNRTIPELLAAHGFFKECETFKKEYEHQAKRFRQMQQQFGQQFLATNIGWASAPKGKFDLVRLPKQSSARCVNDEEALERRFDTMLVPNFWREAGAEQGFDRIPMHCYLYLFHLEQHRNIWVHVENVEPYRYKPELRERLVLPAVHRDLIDILTADLEVMAEDIIEGKSGGTTILCKGAPGLGKTLTAEVYAEVVGKPLYRVHSGQLGVTADSVEANLTQILRRAARWGAILLLDEADVYIRKRDNDLEHNAIVAEFLRTLEYFDGLLFMTTNRMDDVDDAILSRCIAVIRYDTPPPDAARQLWRTLSAQFGADIPEPLQEELLTRYPQISGRDIKELIKLATRYCAHKNMPLTGEVFALCAAFRGIV